MRASAGDWLSILGFPAALLSTVAVSIYRGHCRPEIPALNLTDPGDGRE
jgi:hypothetical protein